MNVIFLHENAHQQNPLKRPLPSNLSQPNASQVPFPFDLNYYHYFPPPRNPVVHPPFPTFQYPHLPPLMSIPLAPPTLAESQYLDLNFPHPPHVNETNHYRHTRNFIRSDRNLPKNYKSKQNRRNTRNLVTINLKRGPPPTKVIPKCLVINARSLAKPDAPSALYTEMISNNIDICFVSKTWLHKNGEKIGRI